MIEQRKHKQKLGLLQLPANRQASNFSSNSAVFPSRNSQGIPMMNNQVIGGMGDA